LDQGRVDVLLAATRGARARRAERDDHRAVDSRRCNVDVGGECRIDVGDRQLPADRPLSDIEPDLGEPAAVRIGGRNFLSPAERGDPRGAAGQGGAGEASTATVAVRVTRTDRGRRIFSSLSLAPGQLRYRARPLSGWGGAAGLWRIRCTPLSGALSSQPFRFAVTERTGGEEACVGAWRRLSRRPRGGEGSARNPRGRLGRQPAWVSRHSRPLARTNVQRRPSITQLCWSRGDGRARSGHRVGGGETGRPS